MIAGVLLDLSGVVYVGDKLLPGAKEALRRLHDAAIPVRFVTNTTRSTRQAIIERLSRMGQSVDPDALFTAPVAAHAYIESHGLSPHLLIHPCLESEFADLPDNEPDAVLVGDAGEGFNYQNLNTAFRHLMNGARLLSMGDNRYFQETEGLSLDIGPFVAALEYATGTKATVLGKPAAEFFCAALAGLGCRADEAVMVGDDAVADVDGALTAGLQGVLVKTGKYRPGDEDMIQSAGAQVVDDIGAAVDWILANRG